MAPAKPRTPRAPKPKPAETHDHAGPTDISDPLVRSEIKRAAVWLGMAALLVLTIYLAQPLLVIFGGMVFAAMIDGGARLLGRVLPIGRGWRVTIVLVLAVAFLAWLAMFAGTQIAAEAAQLPGIIKTQALRFADWLQLQGVNFETQSLSGLIDKAAGGVSQLTSAVGGVIGAFTTAFLMGVMAIYFALEPQLYRRGFAWLLPQGEREQFEGT